MTVSLYSGISVIFVSLFLDTLIVGVKGTKINLQQIIFSIYQCVQKFKKLALLCEEERDSIVTELRKYMKNMTFRQKEELEGERRCQLKSVVTEFTDYEETTNTDDE